MMRASRTTRVVLPFAAAVLVAVAAVVLFRVPQPAASQQPDPGLGSAVSITIPQDQARYTVRRLEADVNADCQVDVVDDQEEARRYFTAVGSLLYGRMYDINLPQTDGVIDISDLQFVLGRNGSTCARPIPPQPPVALGSTPNAGDVTLTKDPNTANIWICNPGAGLCGSTSPTRLDRRDWQNGITFDEVMTINLLGQQISAYSFELKYDPRIFSPAVVADQGLLNENGATTTCTRSEPSFGDVTFSCTSLGPAVTWVGPRTIAKVTLLLQPGVGSQIRPAKENGIVTDVFDVAGIVNGPAPTPEPSQTPSSTATPSPSSTSTATATATNTVVATATETPSATSTASASATPTASATAEASATHTAVATVTATAEATLTPAPSATNTATPVATAVSTSTPVPTATNTATVTATRTVPTRTPMPSVTSTRTPAGTRTAVATATTTARPSGTATARASAT
ncbi:MAG: hypothetical protein IVW36_12460, partial [Dehalococcoidia bacterium]|nr:hypothetical protein [Dehalococcoidia bacterium]